MEGQIGWEEYEEQTAEVGRLIHSSTPGKVLREIEKCDVRCGNCHRIRTAAQFGSILALAPSKSTAASAPMVVAR